MKKFWRWVLTVLACMVCVGVVSCGDEKVQTSITLDATAVQMNVGEEKTLVAHVTGGGSVSYRSTEESIVTVDANGKMSAVSVGEASVIVTESKGNKTAVCLITVVQPVEGVTLSAQERTLTIGESFTLTATISPINASNKRYTFTSSEVSVATVTSGGLVSAKAEGTTTITVKTEDGEKTATCVVNVQKPIALTLNETAKTLGVGETFSIVAKVNNVVETNVSYTVDNTNVISVDELGEVSALAVGNATVTVDYNGKKTATCVITVVKKVASVSLNLTATEMSISEQITLVATIEPSDATNKNKTFSSDTPSVATVDQTGKVTAISTGQATITVTTEDGEKTAICVITVVLHVEGVSLDETEKDVNVGDFVQLEATVSPYDATNKNVSWSTSDASIATVDQTGKVKGIAKGQATITATTEDGGETAQCLIHVKQPVTGVSLDKSAETLGVGENVTLAASVAPETADNPSVSWTTSDANVATVDQAGKVVGVAEGQATITVTTEDGAKTATCTITVINIYVPNYMAVGQSITKENNFTYTIKSGTAMSVETDEVKAVSVGVAELQITSGSFDKTYSVQVIDFGNTNGSTLDLSTDLSLWNYRNYSQDAAQDVSITYAENVADTRGTPYVFNALQYHREQNTGVYRSSTGNMIYLKPEIIALAKEVGYRYFSFTIMVKDDPTGEDATHFYVYNCQEDGSLNWEKSKSDPIYDKVNAGKWTRYSFGLEENEKLHDGAGFGFVAYGKDLYLTNVEFTGADISGFAANYIKESATTGKSVDMIDEDLIGKMYVSVCNTSEMTYVASGSGKETSNGGDDSIMLTKNGYQGTEYFTYNSLKISSEWIQAAKKLGYNVIGIYAYKGASDSWTKLGYIKQGVDGKCYKVGNKAGAQNTNTTTGFFSIDISGFEVGESLVVSTVGGTVDITGITFRNYDGKNGIAAPNLTVFSYDANMA